jgi:hypothetical protein
VAFQRANSISLLQVKEFAIHLTSLDTLGQERSDTFCPPSVNSKILTSQVVEMGGM